MVRFYYFIDIAAFESIYDTMWKDRGELFVKLGLITEEQLKQALSAQKAARQKIEDILEGLGFITKEKITEAISTKLKIPVFSCEDYAVSDELKRLVTKDLAKNRAVLPVERKGNTLVLAIADPLDYRTIDYISFKTKLKISPVISSAAQILKAIEQNYSGKSKASGSAQVAAGREHEEAPLPEERPVAQEKDLFDISDETPASDREISFLDERPGTEEPDASAEILYSKSKSPSIVKLVSMIIAEAAKTRASDIHIEPREKYSQVRFRIDGELRNIFRYNRDIHSPVVSRIKIISRLDITNRRLPQDGGASVVFHDKEVDLRISTAPSIYGDKIVIRLLDQNTGLLPFENLAMSGYIKDSINKLLNRPQGMLIVTGPTGSGKTTTLYACLSQLRSEKRNIITIEDPVEYKLDGITQIQIDETIGRTFSKILRSVLRQDPDIIKIGEIRDLETAEIAIKAALTGHFVLTTLHTNSTIATITRLLNIGIPPYLLGSAISGILAQRLIRKICPQCKIEVEVSEDIEKFIETFGLPKLNKHYYGTGCDKCSKSGYSGRVAVYEYLPMTPKFRRSLSKTINEHEFLAEAKKDGFTFLFEDAWGKVMSGTTSFDEVIAKIPIEYRLKLNKPESLLSGSAEKRKTSEFAFYDELDLE